jgi:hypothetical protein
MTPELRQRLVARARGRCEACGEKPCQECDHFFSRARAEENEATCWMLCTSCHFQKTVNHPNAAHWFRRFIEHCRKYLYCESQQRAEARLFFVETRGTLGSALGSRR